jgi:Toxin SymE, type I toxin-antitoxin system
MARQGARTTRHTVSYLHAKGSGKRMPMIRLRGRYLSDFNFNVGDTVELTVTENAITITKLPNTPA